MVDRLKRAGNSAIVLLFSVLFQWCASVVFAQESITITTYYPAPFGVYTNLRLFPSGQPACNQQDEGTIFYNLSDSSPQLMVCSRDAAGNMTWQGVGLWSRNGNNLFPSDTSLNVGIGRTNPQVRLDVAGAIRPGYVPNNACAASTVGAVRYNNTANHGFLEFCDGSDAAHPAWKAVGTQMKSGMFKEYSGWKKIVVGFAPKMVMVLPHGQGPEAWSDNLIVKMSDWPTSGILNNGPYGWTVNYIKDAEGYDNPLGDVSGGVNYALYGIRLLDDGFEVYLSGYPNRDYSWIAYTW